MEKNLWRMLAAGAILAASFAYADAKGLLPPPDITVPNDYTTVPGGSGGFYANAIALPNGKVVVTMEGYGLDGEWIIAEVTVNPQVGGSWSALWN